MLTPNTVLIDLDNFNMSLKYSIDQDIGTDLTGDITFSSNGVLLLSQSVCYSIFENKQYW